MCYPSHCSLKRYASTTNLLLPIYNQQTITFQNSIILHILLPLPNFCFYSSYFWHFSFFIMLSITSSHVFRGQFLLSALSCWYIVFLKLFKYLDIAFTSKAFISHTVGSVPYNNVGTNMPLYTAAFVSLFMFLFLIIDHMLTTSFLPAFTLRPITLSNLSYFVKQSTKINLIV